MDSVAGARDAREVARGGREVEIFAIRAEIRVLQVVGLVVRTMSLVISMSGRALHTLERARAASKAAGTRGWSLAGVAKSRFSRFGKMCNTERLDPSSA